MRGLGENVRKKLEEIEDAEEIDDEEKEKRKNEVVGMEGLGEGERAERLRWWDEAREAFAVVEKVRIVESELWRAKKQR